jgi:exonuclease III
VDILCLQEVKIPEIRIEEAPGLGMTPDSMDVFWAPSHRRFRGFNGVATYARKVRSDLLDSKQGLTRLASRNVFNDTRLDDEGRALLTDHGMFVVINVYVPNSDQPPAGTVPKMEFLAQLEAVAKVRGA